MAKTLLVYSRGSRSHHRRLNPAPRDRFGRYIALNPRRHHHRRNPAYPFSGMVDVAEPEVVFENPEGHHRHRRHHYLHGERLGYRRRHNPDFDETLREATLGVGGVNEMAGLLSGAFLSQMVPQWFNQFFLKNQAGLHGWADVVATAVSAVAVGIGSAQVNRKFGQSAVAGGLTIALLKGVNQVSAGKYGIASQSPALGWGVAMRPGLPVAHPAVEAAQHILTSTGF